MKQFFRGTACMKNQHNIKERAIRAAEQILTNQGYVSPIDNLVGMKLLASVHVQGWQQGKIPYLEEAFYCNPEKLLFTLKCFRDWVTEKGLKPKEIPYLGKTKDQKSLRIFIDDNEDFERFFRTHYFSPNLSEKEQERLQEKLEKPPEFSCIPYCVRLSMFRMQKGAP